MRLGHTRAWAPASSDDRDRHQSFPRLTQLFAAALGLTLVTNLPPNSGAILDAVQFCSYCGQRAADGAQFCSACGKPVSLGPTDTIAIKRSRLLLAGIVAAVAGLSVVGALAISARMHAARPQPVSPQAVRSQPQPAQMPAVQAAASGSPAPSPTAESQPVAPANAETVKPAPGGIDVQAVQSALAQLNQKSENIPVTLPAQPAQSQAPAAAPESDRYPGSQPVNIDNADLPNIGIPIAKEVYSTSDSVSTVIAYYRQRYPEAQVMEVNGQNIVAVDKPGATKVIAIGTSGQETRIAVVRPAN